jgi:hypothetical protein
MDWGFGSSGRALLCKWEAWSSNPNTAKKKKKERKGRMSFQVRSITSFLEQKY